MERHKFLVLGGLPQQTVFWNQNLTHRNQQVKGGWLLLVCHFLDALQTSDVKKLVTQNTQTSRRFLAAAAVLPPAMAGQLFGETQYAVAEVWRE